MTLNIVEGTVPMEFDRTTRKLSLSFYGFRLEVGTRAIYVPSTDVTLRRLE